MTDIGRNIASAWRAVRAVDIERGALAYVTYHQTIRAMAGHYGVPFERAVLAFVILSPRNRLIANLRSLATCCLAHREGVPAESFQVSGFAKWRIRAMAALDGRVTDADIAGPKIRAFHDNILHHVRSREVCVDGHMVCIASGRDMTMFDALMYGRARGYARSQREIAAAVTDLAIRLRLPPCSVQAILWEWRVRKLRIRADSWPGNRIILPEDIEPYALE